MWDKQRMSHILHAIVSEFSAITNVAGVNFIDVNEFCNNKTIFYIFFYLIDE